MSKRISEKGRERQNRGKGEGAAYTPWIKARDFHNQGTGSVVNDWKTGRRVHLLSQGEKYAYYLLRWDDHVVDIREQYLLELETTVKIAKAYGLKHPKNEETRMTTDLLITYRYDDGNEKYIAYSIKPRREAVEKTPENKAAQEKQKRTLEKLYIERCYWRLKGVKYNLWFKDEMNRTFAENIQLIVRFYDIKEVYSKETAVLFFLANKIIKTDLETEPIAGRLSILTEEYFGESRKWESLLTVDQKKLIKKDFQ